jgi:hypothetical protein
MREGMLLNRGFWHENDQYGQKCVFDKVNARQSGEKWQAKIASRPANALS